MKAIVTQITIKKIYNVLLIILGTIIILYIVYVRLIWQRLPKDLLLNLYAKGHIYPIIFYIIIIILGIVRLGFLLSENKKKKKNNETIS